ncbi:MAG: hypothetical protein AAGN82_09530 [Myxococcota bacterium]
MTRDERLRASLVSVGLLAAVASPLLHGRDSFPLSTFPMFSRARPTELALDHVVLVGPEGHREPVPPALVFSREVLQTKVAVQRAVRRGRGPALALCREVAGRLASSPSPPAVGATVEVRTDRYHVLRYAEGDDTPLEQRVHARCPVIVAVPPPEDAT